MNFSQKPGSPKGSNPCIKQMNVSVNEKPNVSCLWQLGTVKAQL